MKNLLITLCLLPLSVSANSLSHTKWVDAGATKCPDAIFFGVKKYIYFNNCFAKGRDGVIEKGIYSVSENTITLSNRFSTAPSNYEYIPLDSNSIQIISHTQDRLVISIGGKTMRYRRVMPRSSNKIINYTLSGIGSRNTDATYYSGSG